MIIIMILYKKNKYKILYIIMINIIFGISYNKISDYLYLGNYNTACNKEFIINNDIKLVINCSKNLDIPYFYDSNKINYFRIPINDSNTLSDNQILNDNLDYTIDLIKKYRDNKKNVFVHCFAGMQRSAAVVFVYMLHELLDYYHNNINNIEIYNMMKNMTYDDVIIYLKNKRNIVFKNGATFDNLLRDRFNKFKQQIK